MPVEHLTFDPRSLTEAGIPYIEEDYLGILQTIRVTLPAYGAVFVTYHANVRLAYVENHANFPYTRFRSWLRRCGVEFTEVTYDNHRNTA
ncbi:MAG: hypothetical protein ACRBBW_16310 [Cellvibrionaceae bacterium]